MYLTRVRLDNVENPVNPGSPADPANTIALPTWLSQLPVVRALASTPLEFIAPVAILTGDNGAGKSTVMEAIAVAMGANPEGGSRNAFFATTSTSSHSGLSQALICTRRTNPRDVFFLRGESFLNLADYYHELSKDPLNPETVLDDLPYLSHGQSLMKLFRSRIGSQTLLLLDEPEDGLSVFRQLELLGILFHAAQAGTQVILSTHSPILLAIPEAQIIDVSHDLQPTTFAQCEAVTSYAEFIRDPHGTVAYLVGDTHE